MHLSHHLHLSHVMRIHILDIALLVNDHDFAWGDTEFLTFSGLNGMVTGAALTQISSGVNWTAGQIVATNQFPTMTRTASAYQYVVRYTAASYMSGSNIHSFQFHEPRIIIHHQHRPTLPLFRYR